MIKDIDELYMEYDDLVEAGEIDPKVIKVEDFVADKYSDMIDRAMDRYDLYDGGE